MEVLTKKITKKGNVIYKNNNGYKVKLKDINFFDAGAVMPKQYFRECENFFETSNGFIMGGSQVPLIFLQVLKDKETIYINTI